MPVLMFRSQRGTDGPSFNTFRLGGAWSKRLYPGLEVALLDDKHGLFAKALVTNVYFGAIEDMALMFGKDNHMLVGKDVDLPTDMLKVLRNAYGGMIFRAHDSATVIYLQRH